MRLNTAGVVIGWLGLVGSFILTIVLSVVLGYSDMIVKQIMENMKETDPKAYDGIHMMLVVGCSIYLGIVVLNLLASGLLILGTIKERHLMLLPWLINSGISLVMSIIFNFVGLITALSSGMPLELIPSVMIAVLTLALQIYIFYGIYSLFKQIQLTRNEQRPLIQPRAESVPHQTTTYPNYTKI